MPKTALGGDDRYGCRKNVPVKKTKFAHSHVVEYFTAAKALDLLLNHSPWAKAKQQIVSLAKLSK